MRDRIGDEYLAGLAGHELGGWSVPAQLLDLAERGLVALRLDGGVLLAVDLSHRRDPARPLGPAAAAMLAELFGPQREVPLHRHRHARVAAALTRQARDRTRAAGLWRTAAPHRPRDRAIAAALTVAASGIALGAGLTSGPHTGLAALLIGALAVTGLYLLLRRRLAPRELTVAGRAATAELTAWATRCRADPSAGLADRCALGTVGGWPAADPPPWLEGLPWTDPSTNRRTVTAALDGLAAAFRTAPTGRGY